MTFDAGYRLALEIHQIKQTLANHEEYIRQILDKLESKQNGSTNTTETPRR